MASTPPRTDDEVPIIWLAPPAALSPSTHPIVIHPLPIAISATLATLVIVTLILLYHRKPLNINTRHCSVKTANIHVIRPETTERPHSSPRTVPSDSSPIIHAAKPHHSEERNTTEDSIDTTASDSSSSTSASPSQDTTPVQDYHTYLKESLHELSLRNAVDVRSPPGLSYTMPSCDRDLGISHDCVEDVEAETPNADVRRTAVSSDYSVSIGPTPLPSRQNSFRKGQANGAWTRLRLGSEYDGDRTFVPSEANLRLNGEWGGRGA